MPTLQMPTIRRRRSWLRLAVAAVVLGGLLAGYVVVSARGKVPLVTVAQLVSAPDRYRGAQVGLVLALGQRDGDPVAPLITRSDIYLHDDTGSVLLVGGWQEWNRWQAGGCGPYAGEHLEIDGHGIWRIAAATVCYTDDLLPYLMVGPR